MKNVNFGINDKTCIQQLELNRQVYKDVKWLSSHNRNIKIWEMEDNHLLSTMKNIAASIVASSQFPLLEDFKTYNGTSYEDYAQFMYNEVLYRNAVYDQQYEDYINNEIQEDLARERDYYGTWGEYGDCF